MMINGLTGFHAVSVPARPVSFAGYTTGVNNIQKVVIIGSALLTSAYRPPIGLMASPTAKPHVTSAATPSGKRRNRCRNWHLEPEEDRSKQNEPDQEIEKNHSESGYQD